MHGVTKDYAHVNGDTAIPLIEVLRLSFLDLETRVILAEIHERDDGANRERLEALFELVVLPASHPLMQRKGGELPHEIFQEHASRCVHALNFYLGALLRWNVPLIAHKLIVEVQHDSPESHPPAARCTRAIEALHFVHVVVDSLAQGIFYQAPQRGC